VRVRDQSDVLSILGHEAYRVHFAEGKVSKGIGLHKLSADHWKKVPEWMENPVAVFNSDTVPGSLVLIAPETADGRAVFIIVKPDTAMGQDGAPHSVRQLGSDCPGWFTKCEAQGGMYTRAWFCSTSSPY